MLNFRAAQGTTLGMSKETYVSEEFRSDRGITDMRHGTKQVNGDLEFELSYGAFDAWLESACFGAWSSNVLKTGTTMKSFSFEIGFTDIARYHLITGLVVNTMKLSIPPTGIVRGTFGCIGKGFSTSGSQQGAPSDVATGLPFSAVQSTLTEGGSGIAIVTGLEINLDNGLEPNFVVGSDVSSELSYGRSNITGTLTAKFISSALLDKFINETSSSLTVSLTDGTSTLLINLPRIKYSGGALPIDTEQSLTLSMPFQALRDSSSASNIVITRTP